MHFVFGGVAEFDRGDNHLQCVEDCFRHGDNRLVFKLHCFAFGLDLLWSEDNHLQAGNYRLHDEEDCLSVGLDRYACNEDRYSNGEYRYDRNKYRYDRPRL